LERGEIDCKKVRRCVRNIPEYVPGKSVDEVKREFGLSRVIKLASNENPYGASPKVREVLREFDRFHVYPSGIEISALTEMISDYLGVEEERIVIGAGIDGVLETTFKMLVDPGDEVVIPIPTFPYYHTLAKVFDAVEVRVRRGENFEIVPPVPISDRTKIVILCSPNNPTGNVENREVVREIVESSDAIVFIDEAYAEFSDEDLVEMTDYENVILARTFSKAFGLANLRIGYAVVPYQLKKAYMKVSTPFPVSSVAIACAMKALEDLEFVRWCVKRIVKERERLFRRMREFVRVYPSKANFLYFESPIPASKLAYELMKRGVIVRDCSGFVGCSEYAVRVSVGRDDENDEFLRALEDVLS